MTVTRGLYLRSRQVIHEAAKFGVVGAIGFVVNLAGADVLRYDVGLNKYVALTVATVLATIVTFVGNRHWAFRHRGGDGTTRESVLFFVLNGVALLIQYASVWVINDLLGLGSKFWYLGAVVIGTGLGTVFRFWSYRRWVWHSPLALAPPAGIGGGRLATAGAVLSAPTPAEVPRWTGPKHARPRRPYRVPS
jgi:putative flippase GtrA